MVDILLRDVRIGEKRGKENVLTEEYRHNLVEVLAHITKLRNGSFDGNISNPKKFKIVVRKSKIPESESRWVKIEESTRAENRTSIKPKAGK